MNLSQRSYKQGEQKLDPMWRLPLFALYRESFKSPIADINNNSSESYAVQLLLHYF